MLNFIPIANSCCANTESYMNFTSVWALEAFSKVTSVIERLPIVFEHASNANSFREGEPLHVRLYVS